jgi:hypothetical protein
MAGHAFALVGKVGTRHGGCGQQGGGNEQDGNKQFHISAPVKRITASF